MVKVTFEYRDELSKGEWRKQECTVESVDECKKIYGLDGTDPSLQEYRIIKVEEM